MASSRLDKANPKLFRELSEPFESSEAANDALEKFYDEVGAAREKHRIRDVHIIVAGSFSTGKSESGFMSSCHFGDSTAAEAMSAWALGEEQVKRQNFIGSLLKGGIKIAKDR